MDALRSSGSIQGMYAVQNVGASASQTYASALGASLSRSNTPDPQRAPSPRIPPVGGGRANPMDKRNANGSNLFNGESISMSEPGDLVAALSGMTLSTIGVEDEENHSQSLIQLEFDDRPSLFHLRGDQNHVKSHPYLNKSESGDHVHSASHLNKASYSIVGKSSGVGMDLNNSSYIADEQVLKLANAGNHAYKDLLCRFSAVEEVLHPPITIWIVQIHPFQTMA